MEIKKNLKAFDIKISKMASDLGVSRPTLDSYIETFEKGDKISNENYQKIFEYLFSYDYKTSIEFAQRYDYVKRIMVNDLKNNVSDIKLSAYEEDLKQKIILNISNNNVDKNLLEFINLFINNSKNDLVKSLYMYFAYTNGYSEIEENEMLYNDKAFCSQLCKLFSNYKNERIELDEASFSKLLEKNKSQFERKKPKIADEDIIKYIKNNISDSNNIDLDKLKEMINSREEI